MSGDAWRRSRRCAPSRYLTDDAAIAEYMTAVLESDDTDLFLAALGDVGRARGSATSRLMARRHPVAGFFRAKRLPVAVSLHQRDRFAAPEFAEHGSLLSSPSPHELVSCITLT